MARILVTGGAGYVGSVLVEHLLKAGYQVTVLDNLAWGQNSLFGFCHHPGFEFVRGDVRDQELLRGLIAQHEILLPLACLVGAPACDRDPWSAEAINFGAVAMLNHMRSPEQWVIFPNTNSGYGSHSGEVPCTEETRLEPVSLYAQTKQRAEAELLGSRNTLSLRLATVFGMSYRLRLDLLVNDFVHQALTQGSLVLFEENYKRNYVHVRDVADAFVFSLANFESMKGRAYNVGLDQANLSKLELAQLIKRFIPDLSIQVGSDRRDPDQRNYIVSSERLRRAGFSARRTLEEGITELLRGFKMLGRPRFRNV